MSFGIYPTALRVASQMMPAFLVVFLRLFQVGQLRKGHVEIVSGRDKA